MKFTHEMSSEKIVFLDTEVLKGPRFITDKILDVQTHFKPTETFQYTHFSSCHPLSVNKGFVKGENMSGFLRGHSFCTALLKMVDDWRLALDSKKITGSIAIDLSKAFDSICHNLLLAKLRANGLNDDAIAFLQSYLTDRQQRVKFHGKFSEWCPVKCGVPQGGLLGPLLFNIFLNDLNFAGQISSLRLYADDTTTYACDRDIITLEISLNQDLNILVTWFSQTYLIVSGIKTQGMILGSHTHAPEFFIGETKVELANSLKILGVTIDNKLTYCEHISNMLKKVYAKIGVLRRLTRLMPGNVSLSLYKAYLLPHLELAHITQCPNKRFCPSNLSFSVRLDGQRQCKDKAFISHGLQNGRRVTKVNTAAHYLLE